jgi:hypothetical protein
LIGSFIAARLKASAASGPGTPSSSNRMRPGFTRAAQYSIEPLPLPWRTSAGFFDTGTSGALTIEENYEWLSKLDLPTGLDVSFVFNGPDKAIPFFPSLMAAFHDQRMVYYTLADIEALFQSAVPGSEVVWHKSRAETRNKMWETWLILSEADKR